MLMVLQDRDVLHKNNGKFFSLGEFAHRGVAWRCVQSLKRKLEKNLPTMQCNAMRCVCI